LKNPPKPKVPKVAEPQEDEPQQEVKATSDEPPIVDYLPLTGSEAFALANYAAMLVFAGVMLMFVGSVRRRRTVDDQVKQAN
jgi:hypothetical protein